jgi:hypothetical protein
MIKDNVGTYAATVGGVILIGIGLLFFWFPGLLGLYPGVVVNLAHLASGVGALYVGLNSTSLARLRVFCLGLGALYGVAALVGLIFGGPGNTPTILSGHLGLPRMVDLLHLILSAGFIWAGMVQPLTTTMHRAHQAKQGNPS